MTIDEYLEELEAGKEHDAAEYFLREHEGCSLNDLLNFMSQVEGETNENI